MNWGNKSQKFLSQRSETFVQKSQTLDSSVFYLKSIQNIYLNSFYYDLIGALEKLRVNVISAGVCWIQKHYPFLSDPISLSQAPSTRVPCIWVYTAAWSKFHERNHNIYCCPTKTYWFFHIIAFSMRKEKSVIGSHITFLVTPLKSAPVCMPTFQPSTVRQVYPHCCLIQGESNEVKASLKSLFPFW